MPPTTTNTTTTSYPLSPLLTTPMSTPISPSTTSSVLANPPFLPIPNIINIRDLGLLPSSPIPPGLLFRSGALSKADPKDVKQLGVKMILDLRLEGEVRRSRGLEVEGVVNVGDGEMGTGVVRAIDLNDFIEEGGIKAYTAMYFDILNTHAASFKKALEWLRDEQSPILFHCTAGKDRTGVLAALLLSLAGASRDLIAYDYTLTRIGIEPSRELLTQMLRLWNAEWTADTPGMYEFSQVRGEFIMGLLNAVEEKYGGVQGYITNVLGLGEEDMAVVRKVLRGGREEVAGE